MLQSKGRAWAVSHPRMVAMFLARKHTAASYSEIGKHFGGRNHSTAVAAEKKVRQWLAADDELALGQRRIRVANWSSGSSAICCAERCSRAGQRPCRAAIAAPQVSGASREVPRNFADFA